MRWENTLWIMTKKMQSRRSEEKLYRQTSANQKRCNDWLHDKLQFFALVQLEIDCCSLHFSLCLLLLFFRSALTEPVKLQVHARSEIMSTTSVLVSMEKTSIISGTAQVLRNTRWWAGVWCDLNVEASPTIQGNQDSPFDIHTNRDVRIWKGFCAVYANV